MTKQSLAVICQAEVFCERCRSKTEWGRDKRESWAKRFAMPPGGDDFECPLGKPWGFQQQHVAEQPQGQLKTDPATPVPREQWPKWAVAAAAHATPEDGGVGDTVARFTTAMGLASLAKGLKKLTGLGCGCGARQDGWNKRFPYATTER